MNVINEYNPKKSGHEVKEVDKTILRGFHEIKEALSFKDRRDMNMCIA